MSLETNGKIRALALTVAAVTFLVYLPALSNDFVNWDDYDYILENHGLRLRGADFIRWAFTSVVSANWHPVTMISHGVDYALFGLDPRGHHLTNIILHSINTMLVFFLGLTLIKSARRAEGDEKTIPFALTAATVGALLFGLHPIHVESVAWVSERKDVLCALFYLLSVLAYLASRNPASGRPFLYILSLALFSLALMSKPMAVSLPVVLLIIDFHPLGRFNRDSFYKLLAEKLPFFILAALSSAATLWAQKAGGALSSLVEFPFWVRVAVSLRAYTFYLFKTFLPLSLSPVYPYPREVSFFSLEYSGAAALLLALSVVSIAFLRRSPAPAALWAYFLVTLVPVIGIVQVGGQAAADRYIYLPGIALFIAAGLVAARLLRSAPWRGPVIAVLLLALVYLGYRSVSQLRVWQGPLSLWSHTITLYPDDAQKAYSGRAKHYFGEGRYMLALKDYNKALSIADDAETISERGNIYFVFKDYERALADYERALALKPGFGFAHYNSGLIYLIYGNRDEAVRHLRRARALGVAEAGGKLAELGFRK